MHHFNFSFQIDGHVNHLSHSFHQNSIVRKIISQKLVKFEPKMYTEMLKYMHLIVCFNLNIGNGVEKKRDRV